MCDPPNLSWQWPHLGRVPAHQGADDLSALPVDQPPREHNVPDEDLVEYGALVRVELVREGRGAHQHLKPNATREEQVFMTFARTNFKR
jgi:hypothetical protein